MAAFPIWMPLRNEPTAPYFDTSRPRELPRYFEDLEDLLDRASIINDTDKKKYAVRYTDFDTEQIWKASPEFKDPSVSYGQFKTAIIFLYPDASDDFRYSLQDMDLLIREQQLKDITSAKELSDFHLRFLAITTWLIDKARLSNLEQQRAYIQAFQPQLLSAIMYRLQIKNPDHHPNIPFPVEKVYEAAQFVLHGNSSLGLTSAIPSTPLIPSPAIPSHDTITVTDIIPLMADFTKAIVDAIRSSRNLLQPENVVATKSTKPRYIPVPLHPVAPRKTVTTTHIHQPFTISDDERIAEIEAEIYFLKNSVPSIEATENSQITPSRPTVQISDSKPTTTENSQDSDITYSPSIRQDIAVQDKMPDINQTKSARYSRSPSQNSLNSRVTKANQHTDYIIPPTGIRSTQLPTADILFSSIAATESRPNHFPSKFLPADKTATGNRIIPSSAVITCYTGKTSPSNPAPDHAIDAYSVKTFLFNLPTKYQPIPHKVENIIRKPTEKFKITSNVAGKILPPPYGPRTHPVWVKRRPFPVP